MLRITRSFWRWVFHTRTVDYLVLILEETHEEVKEDIRNSRWDEDSTRRAIKALERSHCLLKIRLDLPK